MNRFISESRQRIPTIGTIAAEQKQAAAIWHWLWLVAGLAILAMPTHSYGESRMGTASANASLVFRIVVPAIIRVASITQPAQLVIEDHHIAQGFIDLDAGTSVKLTVNSRHGYQLTARHDPQLLSRVEVRVSSQSLNTSSGFGSMRVVSGLIIDQLVPISYRFHLAPGVQAGGYRWPVALAFSLAAA